MQPINPAVGVEPDAEDPTLRRRLIAELHQFRERFANTGGQLGEVLLRWRQEFYEASRCSPSIMQVVTEYATGLDELLMPFVRCPMAPMLQEVATWLQRYQSCPNCLVAAIEAAMGTPVDTRRELQQVEELLVRSSSTDPMVESIRHWHSNFLGALGLPGANEEEVLQRYIVLMQELLVDAVTGNPLDAPVYLGSDGRSYGATTIDFHRLMAPHIHQRSFFEMDDEEAQPFTSTSHDPVVEHMIGWLRLYGAYQSPERNVEFFEVMRRAFGLQEMTPQEREEQRGRLEAQERAEQEGAEEAEQQQDDFEEFLQGIAGGIEEEFAVEATAFQAHMEADAGDQQEEIEALQRQDGERLALLEAQQREQAARLAALEELIRRQREEGERIDEELAATAAEAEALDAEVERLQRQQAAQQQRREEVARRAGALERQEEELRQQRENLQRQEGTLRQQAEAAERAAEELREDILQAEEDVAEIREQQEELRQEQNNLDRDQARAQETLTGLQRIQGELHQKEQVLMQKKFELVEAQRRAEEAKSRGGFLRGLLVGVASVVVIAIFYYATGGVGLFTGAATVSGGSGAGGVTSTIKFGVGISL